MKNKCRPGMYLGGPARIWTVEQHPPECPLTKAQTVAASSPEARSMGYRGRQYAQSHYLDGLMWRWVHPDVRCAMPAAAMVPVEWRASLQGGLLVVLRYDTSPHPTRAAVLRFYETAPPKWVMCGRSEASETLYHPTYGDYSDADSLYRLVAEHQNKGDALEPMEYVGRTTKDPIPPHWRTE